jgi:hypothetical protein
VPAGSAGRVAVHLVEDSHDAGIVASTLVPEAVPEVIRTWSAPGTGRNPVPVIVTVVGCPARPELGETPVTFHDLDRVAVCRHIAAAKPGKPLSAWPWGPIPETNGAPSPEAMS